MTGEKMPGDLKKWDYFGTDPNELLSLSYDVLCQRSITLFHTHGPVSSAINKNTMYAIGNGLHFRSQPDFEILGITREAAKDWGLRFQKLVHYIFQILNFYEKQASLFRTAQAVGDSLLFFDREKQSNGMPFDLIDTAGDQIDFQASGATLGIIHDSLMRKKGIILNNGKKINFKDENGDQNVIQFYLKQLSRQLRGYPLAYKIIAAAKNNDRWWDAMLQRVVLESIIFATTEEDTEDTRRQAIAMADSFKNSDTETSSSALTTDANAADMGPGTVFSYNKGNGIKFTEGKTPVNNFDKMQDAYIDIIGMAMDTAPEVILSKYSTSYTAHKGAINDFIKAYMQKRHTFINHVCNPVVLEIAKYLFMEKLIEMPVDNFFENAITQRALIAGNWLGPVPGHINPLQEAKANETQVLNAFKLRGDVSLESGNEYENFIEEWQQQEKQWRKATPEEKTETFIEEDQEDENINP